MPFLTDSISTWIFSAKLANSFMKDIRVASMALEAYLVNSALLTFITNVLS